MARPAELRRLGYLSGAPRVSTRPDAEAGGPRAHVVGVIRAMQRRGLEVRPFIVGDRVPARLRGGGSERSMAASRGRLLAADLVRLVLARLSAHRAWRQLGGEVDCVYERFAAFQALGRGFRRRGVPWILETNAPLFIEATQDRRGMVLASLACRLERAAYRDCDLLVVISQTLAERLVETAGVAPGKIVVIPNGVDPERFDADAVQPRRRFEALTVGFVGGLHGWQRLDLLLEAVAALRNEGERVAVTVVGDGSESAALAARAEALGIASSVALVGRVPWAEVPAWIAGFDLGYSGPTPLEGGSLYLSPLKLYEYMAMSRPVLASMTEDARTLVGDSATGFLFAPGDAAGLRQALRRALRARAELPAMGRRARAVIAAGHTWDRRVETLLARVATSLGLAAPGAA